MDLTDNDAIKQRMLTYAMKKNPLANITNSLRVYCAVSRIIDNFGMSIIIGAESFYILRVSAINGYISIEKVNSSTLEQKWERHCLSWDIERYIIKHIPSKQQDVASLLIEAHSNRVKSYDSLINHIIHLPADLIAIINEFLNAP